jgi:steroid delta-isomerase-like uncharacterized protein
MSTDEHKTLIRRWWDGLSQGNAAELIDEVYAPDYVLHDPSLPEPVQGLEGVHEFIAAVTAAFPDGQATVEDLVAEEDRVVQRVTYRGTHQGEFLGVPATGKAVSVWVMVISRIADGKIAEEWQLVDGLGLMQQLGALPAAEQGG